MGYPLRTKGEQKKGKWKNKKNTKENEKTIIYMKSKRRTEKRKMKNNKIYEEQKKGKQ